MWNRPDFRVKNKSIIWISRKKDSFDCCCTRDHHHRHTSHLVELKKFLLCGRTLIFYLLKECTSRWVLSKRFDFFFHPHPFSHTRAHKKQGCESIWRLKCIFSSAHFVKLGILPSLFLFSVFKKQQHTMNCLDDDDFFLFAAFKTRRFFIYSINKILWWDCIWMEKFMFSLLSLSPLVLC